MNSILLVLFFVGVFITWGTEAVGSIIKKVGMKTKKNLLSASFVQSLSILSRFGFFLQVFVVAWIVDGKMYLESRDILALGYAVTVLLSLITVQLLGPKSLFKLFNLLTKRFKLQHDDDNSNISSVKLNLAIRPTITQLVGYILLYIGGIFPLLIQLVFPEFAARGLAVAGIVNGLSTILLIAINETKMSIEIHKIGYSKIPDQLYVARYISIWIVLIILIIFNILNYYYGVKNA